MGYLTERFEFSDSLRSRFVFFGLGVGVLHKDCNTPSSLADPNKVAVNLLDCFDYFVSYV